MCFAALTQAACSSCCRMTMAFHTPTWTEKALPRDVRAEARALSPASTIIHDAVSCCTMRFLDTRPRVMHVVSQCQQLHKCPPPQAQHVTHLCTVSCTNAVTVCRRCMRDKTPTPLTHSHDCCKVPWRLAPMCLGTAPPRTFSAAAMISRAGSRRSR